LNMARPCCAGEVTVRPSSTRAHAISALTVALLVVSLALHVTRRGLTHEVTASTLLAFARFIFALLRRAPQDGSEKQQRAHDSPCPSFETHHRAVSGPEPVDDNRSSSKFPLPEDGKTAALLTGRDAMAVDTTAGLTRFIALGPAGGQARDLNCFPATVLPTNSTLDPGCGSFGARALAPTLRAFALSAVATRAAIAAKRVLEGRAVRVEFSPDHAPQTHVIRTGCVTLLGTVEVTVHQDLAATHHFLVATKSNVGIVPVDLHLLAVGAVEVVEGRGRKSVLRSHSSSHALNPKVTGHNPKVTQSSHPSALGTSPAPRLSARIPLREPPDRPPAALLTASHPASGHVLPRRPQSRSPRGASAAAREA
jgi:hypothetical protein